MSALPLGRATLIASSVIQDLQHAGIDARTVIPVGGLRRFTPAVREIELLALADARARDRVLGTFTTLASARQVALTSSSAATIVTTRGQVTLHVADPAAAGAALVWYTGSSAHVAVVADLAAGRGLQLADGALTDNSGRPVRCTSEDEFYALVDLPWIAPELREATDELDAARDRRLPRLITGSDVRGDLHMHSTWSDGRDTMEAMVRASIELRYEYVAMTDHSQRAWSSRKLALEDIADQRAEVNWLRGQYRNIRILHGVEVDIMKDRTLDFEDDVLAGFDIVLASLHDHGGQDGEELTERYLSAMRSPFVDIITHPLNRTPAVSDGYDLDLNRLFAAAAETGTAMEVDGAPGHLDMDGAVARHAAAAGVTIVVDSDCHRTEALDRQMRFGIGTARRGWLEPKDVLNTRPLEDVLAFVARKRARG